MYVNKLFTEILNCNVTNPSVHSLRLFWATTVDLKLPPKILVIGVLGSGSILVLFLVTWVHSGSVLFGIREFCTIYKLVCICLCCFRYYNLKIPHANNLVKNRKTLRRLLDDRVFHRPSLENAEYRTRVLERMG